MSMDMLNFTPGTSAAGGALIGLAAAIFILVNGPHRGDQRDSRRLATANGG